MASAAAAVVSGRHSPSLRKPTVDSSVGGDLPARRHRNLIYAWPRSRRSCNLLGFVAAEIRVAPLRPPLTPPPPQVTRRSEEHCASTRTLAGCPMAQAARCGAHRPQ